MSFLRELSARRSALAAPVSLTAIALTILLAGCPEETPPPTPRAYTCDFGTPVDGTTTEADLTGCQTCNDEFEFQGGATTGGPGINCVATTPYVCTNGDPIPDAAANSGMTGCLRCNNGFALNAAEGGAGVSCVTPYVCENGTRIFDDAPSAGSLGCQTCNAGYTLSAAQGGVDVTCLSLAYVCTNGNPISGNGATPGLTGCQSCTGDFALDAAEGGAGVSCVTPYICTNGERIFDAAPAADMQGCRECSSGHALSSPAGGAGVTCLSTSYTCTNGNPIPGTAATPGDTGCQTCNRDYTLSAAMGGIGVSCVSDADNDTIADSADNCPNIPNTDQDAATGATAGRACDTDIDDDDDGLIEIWTLEQLHNMRYNLAGTSYDDEEADTGTDADTGVTTGAGATEHANCDDGDAMTTVVLCGYELMQDLDFDLDGDGSTLNPDGTLDTDDDASPHFVVADGGWEPVGITSDIGISVGRFAAIFDGNGNAIYNLAIISNTHSVGLFGTAGAGSHIRNVGIIGGLITNTGSSPTVIHSTGPLVGVLNNGDVTASYATANVNGGNSSRTAVGGLIGRLRVNASVAVSYATGNANAGSRNDAVGGLIGRLESGTVTASYATGNVNGGSGNDNVGGLVGANIGTVTASYATGDVDGGTDTDGVGSLVGANANTITASYGFGEVTNGRASALTSPMPAGITAATALTAANTAVCSNRTYTTETACTSTSLAITAGAWDSTEMECSAPGSGATAGVDYTTYTTMATCTAPGTKTAADTWTTWSNASDNTLNAWVFANGVTPKLRYADYDGTGTTYACSLFPSTVTCGASGDQLPGQ